MRHLFTTAAAVLSAAALAQAPAPEQDHTAHHPPGASAPVPASRATADQPSQPAVPKAQADMTMTAMREMHDRMMAAKTPEERQALMADHMKLMHQGMAMMGRMRDARPEGATIGMRMDMMEMMLQMMMDREAARAPAAK